MLPFRVFFPHDKRRFFLLRECQLNSERVRISVASCFLRKLDSGPWRRPNCICVNFAQLRLVLLIWIGFCEVKGESGFGKGYVCVVWRCMVFLSGVGLVWLFLGRNCFERSNFCVKFFGSEFFGSKLF
jgi:hypothetical protein